MRGNPQDREQPEKAYANAQTNGTLDLNAFAEHIISHGSVYSKGDILAIITIAIACIQELVLNGWAIDLGDLGKFAPRISSKGAASFEEFNCAAHIKKVSIRWTPTKILKNLKDKATFQRVLTKTEEAKAKQKIYGK